VYSHRSDTYRTLSPTISSWLPVFSTHIVFNKREGSTEKRVEANSQALECHLISGKTGRCSPSAITSGLGMIDVPTPSLLAHASGLKGAVVLITGQSSWSGHLLEGC
jgi:hypothetical protein